MHPGATPITGLTPYDAAPVAGSTNGRELSHWIKYHQAAYQNATDLGSPAVQRHEAHFREVINGELMKPTLPRPHDPVRDHCP